MNSAIEQEFYQNIGRAALDMADDLAGKLLIYAEIQDGATSCDLFYENEEGVVRLKFCSDALNDLIYSLWERWKEKPAPDNKEWRVMTYRIEDDKLQVNFTYPDQINEDEDVSDRRPLVIKEYFGDTPVDYSQPS